MCIRNLSPFPEEFAFSVFSAGIGMSTLCKHEQLFPSVASTSRRKGVVGEMPSKKPLMKREGESEVPILDQFSYWLNYSRAFKEKDTLPCT